MGDEANSTSWTPNRDVERRRLKWYWIGLCTYLLILLNVARIASTLPYQLFVFGAVLNGAIVVAIIILIKRTYRRIQKPNTPGG
jgi:hypothetical protein